MNKILYLLFVVISMLYPYCSDLYAQQEQLLENDSLLKAYLRQKNFDIDPSAAAVILFEKGTAEFSIKESAWGQYYQVYQYKMQKCIKLNSQEALGLADITIPYFKGLKVSDIDFQTFNLVEENVQKQKLRKSNILKEDITKNIKVYKFSLPNVKAGSIIYYSFSYEIELGRTTGSLYFPVSWNFQHNYPVLDSRFELTVPYEIKYTIIPKNVTFKKTNSVSTFETSDNAQLYTTANMQESNKKALKNQLQWIRKNVKGNAQENYVLNTDNKLEKINIYVSSYFPNTYIRSTNSIYSNWEEANNSFFYDQLFLGTQIFEPSDTLSFILNKIIPAGETSNLNVAKAIYKYVRDSIKCLGAGGNKVWLERFPKSVLVQKEGTISDINGLLAALYRKAGFKSYPVLFSTANDISGQFFEPDALDYFVALLVIDNKYYYLDASSKHLPFGILQPECYVDFAWLVSDKGIPIAISADSLVEKNTCYTTLTPTAKPGVFVLKMDQRLGNVDGPALRGLLQKDSVKVKKEIEQKVSQWKQNTTLKKFSINHLNNPDTGLVLSFEMELTLDPDAKTLYLDPFFMKFFDSNPFINSTRRLPVEFGHTFNRQYILKMELPEGYEPEEYNNPANLDFANGSIYYQNKMNYTPENRTYYLSSHFRSRAAVIPASEYPELRSFYDHIITEQNKKIVIRKVN